MEAKINNIISAIEKDEVTEKDMKAVGNALADKVEAGRTLEKEQKEELGMVI